MRLVIVNVYKGFTVLFIFTMLITAVYYYTHADESVHEEISTGEEERRQVNEEAENAYALRMQYAQDIMLSEAYKARMQYAAEKEEMFSIRSRIVDYALSFVGVTPYVWAGRSLWTGTDCSGFVHLIFAEFGYWLPTGSDAYQWGVGSRIGYEERMPGDIIVYDNGAHVGIYIGNDLVVHCSSPENGTVCWNMWYRYVTAIVRVLP